MSAPGTWEAWDWYGICRRLLHGESHYRPWEILRLTEPEILAALDDDLSQRRPPTGGVDLNAPGAAEAYIQRLRAMSPEERLRRAMEDD